MVFRHGVPPLGQTLYKVTKLGFGIHFVHKLGFGIHVMHAVFLSYLSAY